MKQTSCQEMLNIYHQGPEAVIAVLHALFDEIEKLQCRVEQLKNQGKKTQKPATSRLLPTNFISQKVSGKKPIENLADSLDMSVTH